MFLWLLSACLGLVPIQKQVTIVSNVAPPIASPILVPTSPPTPSTGMPTAPPGAMPGAMPGGVPGVMPGGIPGAMPGVVPGSMPGGIPGAMPGGIPGAMPGVVPGAMPGVFPGAMPGGIPGAMPGVVPGAMPGVFPGAMPGGIPGAMPGLVPGAMPGFMPGFPGGMLGMPAGMPGVPGANMGVPGANMGVPGTNMGVPGTNMGFPGTNMGYPGTNAGMNMPTGVYPGMNIMPPGSNPGVSGNPFVINQGNNPFANNPSQFAQINMANNQPCDPFSVCLANPNDPSTVSGSAASYSISAVPAIDPRLGTTPSSLNGAVNFPRQKRRAAVLSRRRRQVTNANCACVPAGTCPANGAGNFGNGFIDFRIVTPVIANPPSGVACAAGLVYCCVGGSNQAMMMVGCGVVQQVPPSPTTVAGQGQASFGEFPWQAMILSNQNDYIAGAVLIDQFNVLTVIHRLQPYIVSGTAPNAKVRLGEWDAAAAIEPIPFQEFPVTRVFTHPRYNAQTLQYDLAVVRLGRPVPISPQPGAAATINRACLPANSALTYNSQRCMVAGWGKNAFGTPGNYQQILKKVDVPVVDPATCQNSLRSARLGPNFILDATTFICAGGEASKDSCTGDGGSGLVCSANGVWTVIGIVSWGLGCAASGVPGVYINVASLSDWIRQQQAIM